MKFGPVVQEEMSLKEKVYGQRMDDGQRLMTQAHIQPLAFFSSESVLSFIKIYYTNFHTHKESVLIKE